MQNEITPNNFHNFLHYIAVTSIIHLKSLKSWKRIVSISTIHHESTRRGLENGFPARNKKKQEEQSFLNSTRVYMPGHSVSRFLLMVTRQV